VTGPSERSSGTAPVGPADRLRVAVIGTGFVGPFHVDAVRRGGYGDVVALVGSDPARTAGRAASLGVARAMTVEAVMSDRDIDVIHICTPNRTHAELAAAAIAAGKHVVIEKPVGLSVPEGRRIADLARSAGRHAAVAYTYRGYPMVRRARTAVDTGELGTVRLIHGAYLQDWLAAESDYNWRLDPAQSGESRAVADIGTHWFDTVEYVSGLRVEAVCADLATFIPVRDRPLGTRAAFSGSSAVGGSERVAVASEDAATILVRFAGGARGVCVVSQVSPGRKNAFSIEVAGSSRSLDWNQEAPEHLWLRERDQATLLTRDAGDGLGGSWPGVPPLPAGHPEGWSDALRDVLRGFYAAVTRGDPVPSPGERAGYPSVDDGLRGLLFVDAVLRSSREQRWVSLAVA
jgi:predicted dehydrogenase